METARRHNLNPAHWAVLACGLGLLFAVSAQAGGYAPGDVVEVTGQVTDPAGAAVPGVEVILTGSRSDFDPWGFRWRRRGASSLEAVTDENGAFSIEWRWDRFYNRFSLAAGIRRPGSDEDWWELAKRDLTRAVKRGSPVVVQLTVESAEEVEALQLFAATLDSDDARRVYQELGKPDKVTKIRLPRLEEVTWWYFDRGMVYRFIDGQLDSSESFAPVEPI